MAHVIAMTVTQLAEIIKTPAPQSLIFQQCAAMIIGRFQSHYLAPEIDVRHMQGRILVTNSATMAVTELPESIIAPTPHPSALQ